MQTIDKFWIRQARTSWRDAVWGMGYTMRAVGHGFKNLWRSTWTLRNHRVVKRAC